MSTPKIDKNMWYEIYLGDSDSPEECLQGKAPYEYQNTRGSVSFLPTDNEDKNQQWQIYPFNSSFWVLRTAQDSSVWLSGETDMRNDADTYGKPLPCLIRGDVADKSILWTFSPWGDGTWFLTNAGNGTGYHLQRKSEDDGNLIMSTNTTAPQNDQRFRFKAISSIDNSAFSTFSLTIPGASTPTPTPGSSASTSSTSSPNSSVSTALTPPTSSPTNPSSSGLSTGAKAAIGATLGAVGLIALVVLGLFLMKRRRRHAQSRSRNDVLPPYHHSPTDNNPLIKYEMFQEGSRGHEVEAPRNEQPVELVGDPVALSSPHPTDPVKPDSAQRNAQI